MEAPERRTSRRHASELDGTLWIGARSVRFRTVDISDGGIRIKVGAALALHQLLPLQVASPVDQKPVDMLAVVSRLDLNSVSLRLVRAADEAWRAVVRHCAVTRKAVDALCAVSPAQRVRLLVNVASRAQLLEIYTRDVASGRLFYPTPHRLLVGTPVRLTFAHPASRATFYLDGVVCKRSPDSTRQGLPIRLLGVDAQKRMDFLEFVTRGSMVGSEAFARSRRDWVH